VNKEDRIEDDDGGGDDDDEDNDDDDDAILTCARTWHSLPHDPKTRREEIKTKTIEHVKSVP